MSDFSYWAIVTFLLVGLVYLAYTSGTAYFSTSFFDDSTYGAEESEVWKMIVPYIQFISNIIPLAGILFGFAADILVYHEFKASLPSFVCLAIVLVNAIASRVVFSMNNDSSLLSTQSVTNSTWCSIPGLEELESPYIPMIFTITSFMLTYYGAWNSIGASQDGVTTIIAVSCGVVLAQMASFGFISDCPKFFQPLTFYVKSPVWNILLALLIGSVVGGSTFLATFYTDAARWNPISTRNSNSREMSGPTCKDGSTPDKTPSGRPGCKTQDSKCPDGSTPFKEDNVSYCSPTVENFENPGHTEPVQEDEQTFVAEIYKNGQLVTESIA